MTNQTLRIITAAVEGDPSLSPQDLKRILQACKDPTATGAARSVSSRLLSARQAAEILGTSKRTVFRYAEQGLLHPVKLSPRTVRFTTEDIESLCTKGGGSW